MAFDDIDLQWFASAEEEGRTEEPSEYKLRKAREEEGRVPKSTELTGSIVMLFCVVTLILIARWILAMCETVMQFYFSRCAVPDIARLSFAGVFFRFFVQMILPISIVAIIAGVVANIAQNRGFIFTTKPITPDFTKIVPRIGQYVQKTVFRERRLRGCDLPGTSVNKKHVRERHESLVLFREAPHAAAYRLVDTGKVILCLHGFHTEFPVFSFGWLPVFEHDHGGNYAEAACVGDVIRLNPARRLVQGEHFLQPVERFYPAFRLALGAQALLSCVPHRRADQLTIGASARNGQFHSVSG